MAVSDGGREAIPSGGAAASPVETVVPGNGEGQGALFARAMACLSSGKNLFLPSMDGLDAEAERELKGAAAARGLLAMGPGASSAWLSGNPFGVACSVERGPLGVVGTDGGAIRELTSLAYDHQGTGISHAIDVGSRDLSSRVGGLMTEAAVGMLAADEGTKAVCLVGHRPSDEMAARLHQVLSALGKPAVVRWLGEAGKGMVDGVFYAEDIDEAAQAGALLCRGEPLEFRKRCARCPTCLRAEKLRQGKELPRRLVWLSGNGALAMEAAGFLRRRGLEVTMPLLPMAAEGAVEFSGSLVVDVDMGACAFGELHPAMDIDRQAALVRKAVADRSVGVVLFDVSLGVGAHPDPGPCFAEAVLQGLAARGDDQVVAMASITGTSLDDQNFELCKALLKDCGVCVAPTSAKAARIASELVG